MLTARREPTFDVSSQGPGDAVPAYSAPQGSRISRWVNVFQLVGSLLAVPVGLGSAYSLYRANFSPETTCQSLRAGIIAMLDKNVDATTRRVLVRHDVEAFEQTCGSVDPEATKAFKRLLAEKAVVSPPPAPAPKVERSAAPPKPVVRKIEPHAPAAAKQPTAGAPAPREATDTQWLDAVRQAMAKPKPEASARAEVAAPRPTPEALAMPAPGPAPVAAAVGPPVTLAPAPPAAADHPVPPVAIPDAPATATAPPQSRLGRLIAKVPLLGPVWENGRR